MSQTILIVGAAGNLGQRIAAALLGKPGVTVRLGVRDPDKSQDALSTLVAAGGEVVRTDLADPASLDAACADVEAIVSTVQGGREIIVDGQMQLLEAARRAGVARVVPSDFSLDLFALDEGENWNSDLRRSFDVALRDSGVGYTFFFNGGFMEAVLSPFIGMVDRRAGTLSFWGDGETPIDLTSMDDAAAFCAEAVLDPGTMNRAVMVVGERIAMPALARAFEPVLGRALELRSLGSIADGYAELERLRRTTQNPMELLPLMYQLPMVSGKARLRNIDNARYPNVQPLSVAAFLERSAAPSASATPSSSWKQDAT